MDLLVTGGSGLVGWDFVNRATKSGHKVAYTYYSTKPDIDLNKGVSRFKVDVRDRERVHELVRNYNPDAVVHTAAMTDVDGCEKNHQRAKEINVDGTRHVVAACESVDAHLLFFSTGFVFDGDGEKFHESDNRNSVNHYGTTKIRAEDIVSASEIPSSICRIDQPYCWSMSWQKDTFVSWVLNQCKKGKPFPIFTDWYNTPVYVPNCNKCALELLEKKLTGTFHIVGDDYRNRYKWAKMIARIFDYNPQLVEKGHSKEVSLPAARPNNHLLNEKVEKSTNFSFCTITEGLHQMKSDLKERF